MNPTLVNSLVETAKIHEKWLTFALNECKSIFPITASKILMLSNEEFLLLELLGSRFSKLQDFIGSKLITVVLTEMGEFSTDLSMIDKLNRLEKFHLITDAKLWTEMRQVRNQLSHEYPDNPDLQAQHLNKIYDLSFELIECLNRLIRKISDKLR